MTLFFTSFPSHHVHKFSHVQIKATRGGWCGLEYVVNNNNDNRSILLGWSWTIWWHLRRKKWGGFRNVILGCDPRIIIDFGLCSLLLKLYLRTLQLKYYQVMAIILEWNTGRTLIEKKNSLTPLYYVGFHTFNDQIFVSKKNENQMWSNYGWDPKICTKYSRKIRCVRGNVEF